MEAAAPQKKTPRLGCAGLVLLGDRVLLGKRTKEPNQGRWILPGGVRFGESFEQALSRELLEETGVTAAFSGVYGVRELLNPPDEHRVVVFLRAEHLSGNPSASSDISEVGFFSRAEVARMSAAGAISPFVEGVLRDAGLL